MKNAQKNKNWVYLVLIIALILVITLLVLNIFQGITGKSVENEAKNYYTYTKAICDEEGYCEDYIIECSNEETVSLTPTGFSIQTGENWKDPREKESIDKLC